MMQINARESTPLRLARMALESPQAAVDPQQLASSAHRLEQLAQFACRPDVRIHMFERAAECLAKAVLIRAAHGPQAQQS